MLWRLHIWWLLSLGLISCSPRSPQVALSREAYSWQELVRGDEERMAESREATVKALAESGQVSLAQELALSIPNYKRGTSWAEIATILVSQGKLGEAAKLFPAPTDVYRVNLKVEQDTIIARLVRAAMASGNDEAAREMAKGMSSPEGARALEQLIQLGESPLTVNGAPVLIGTNASHPVSKLSSGLEGAREGESGISSDRMTMEMLLAEMEGKVRVGKKEEARALARQIEEGLYSMKTVLRRPVYWMRLARMQWELGLRGDAQRSYDEGMERIRKLNPRLEFLDLAYADAVVVRAGLENPAAAKQMVADRVEEISRRDPGNPFPMPVMDEYFQMDAFASLAKGAWQAGNHDQARELWSRALSLAEKNPNPRSRAIGAVQVLLSHAAVNQVPEPDLRRRLDKLRGELPEAYRQLSRINGGAE
jgi:tetratricopeptide (TPR) repeat protein